MIKTILLSLMLTLVCIWLTLGIVYFYMKYLSPFTILRKEKGEKDKHITKNTEKPEKEESQTAFVLMGKSRTPSPVIPKVPSTSPNENPKKNNHNFVQSNSGEAKHIQEEENEMDIEFEMERIDENELVREELDLSIKAATEDNDISGNSILARDLIRMQQWQKHGKKTDDGEIRQTIGMLHGTVLLEKYKENMARMQGGQTELLEKIRKAEEGLSDEASVEDAVTGQETAANGSDRTERDEKPLSYYL